MTAPIAAQGALVALVTVFTPAQVQAECSTASTGAGCVTTPREGLAAGDAGRRVVARQRSPRFAPGDVLPAGRYQMLLNSAYYGLPPVRDGWRYYEVEGRVLRVRPDTLVVVGDATAETNRAF